MVQVGSGCVGRTAGGNNEGKDVTRRRGARRVQGEMKNTLVKMLEVNKIQSFGKTQARRCFHANECALYNQNN